MWVSCSYEAGMLHRPIAGGEGALRVYELMPPTHPIPTLHPPTTNHTCAAASASVYAGPSSGAPARRRSLKPPSQ